MMYGTLPQFSILMIIMINCILGSDIDIAIQIYNQMGGKLESGEVPGINTDDHGNVIEIIWFDRGLKGPIPSDIGDLKNLQTL